jgi:hypothetical protein
MYKSTNMVYKRTSHDGCVTQTPKLTMLIHRVSRCHSLRVDGASSKTMFIILGYLRNLSAPCLTHVSVQLLYEDWYDNSVDWHVAIFSGCAPLLHTVHLRGIALSNCNVPPATIVELEVDARAILYGFIYPKVFTHMPNLRVLNIRGSFLWSDEDLGDNPVTLPMLERLTWGCLDIRPLLVSIVTPALRYLCLTTTFQEDDKCYVQDDDTLQDFPDAITDSPYIPILPNLDELCYDIRLLFCWSAQSFPCPVSTSCPRGGLGIVQ